MTQAHAVPASGYLRTPGEASLSDIAGALRRKWRWIAIPTLATFIAATIFVFTVSPRYTGEAKILLQAGDTSFTRPGTGSDRSAEQQPVIDEQAVASQVQVVMSRDLAQEAIRRLGLVGNAEFDPEAGGFSLTGAIKSMLGLTGKRDLSPEDRIVERYYERLLVYPVGKSRIVAIEFRSADPSLAARAANTIAELYLGLQEDAKKDQARSASAWLGSNIDGLRKRVAEAEAKVETFRAKTGLISGSGTSTLSAQQLSELSSQLAQARGTRSDTQAKAKLIRDTLRDGRAFDIPDVANNELIRRLLEQRVGLKAQLALELRTLMPQHPRIKELNAQLSDLESQIRIAAERTVRTLENDAKIAGSRVEALEAATEQQKKVVAEANGNEVQLRALEREARVQREQLETYLSRYRDATARDTDYGVPADARIVSRAVAPQLPSFPKKGPIIALSTIAMLLLTAGGIISRELLSGAGSFPRPVQGQGPEPTVARPRPDAFEPEATRTEPEPSRSLIPAPRSVLERPADSLEQPDLRFDYTSLSERVAKTPISGRGRRVLVTGLSDHDEADRVAKGLGLTLTTRSRTILVAIEPDEESPVDAVPGLTDLLAGEADFVEVIRRDAGSALDQIGPGTLMNETLLADPDDLDVALDALDEAYGWVVVVLCGPDHGLLSLLAPRMDAVVLVSDLSLADPQLLGGYEAIRDVGGKDVIVASSLSERVAEAA